MLAEGVIALTLSKLREELDTDGAGATGPPPPGSHTPRVHVYPLLCARPALPACAPETRADYPGPNPEPYTPT